MGNLREERTGQSTLRLLMPQWQGGGYRPTYGLGARLLAWLAPESDAPLVEVPIDGQLTDHAVTQGIYAREIVLQQARAAKEILWQRQPEKVVVFGGECSVDFAPFAYLNERYDSDLAVLWLDAHPDVTLPYEDYPNFHAMVLGALLGVGDAEYVAEVPVPLQPSQVLYVGLRGEIEHLDTLREKHGIALESVSAAQVEADGSAVLNWLRKCGASRVAVHFDLDVLDPREFTSAVGQDPDGLRAEVAIRLLADVAEEYEIVGLGITEYTPRDAALLHNMLRRLPIVNE